jgi:hypothetical protein
VAGTSTTLTPTCNGVAAAVAVLAREPDQGVAMTYAASGSSGINLGTSSDYALGTGSFTRVWCGSLPAWNVGTPFYYSLATGSIRNYFKIYTDSKLLVQLNTTEGFNSTVAVPFAAGTRHELVVVVTRNGASGTLDFYADGVALGTKVALNADQLVDLGSPTANYIMGDAGSRSAGTTHHAYLYNRALTAAEVLDLYRNGISESDKWGSQTEQTSGTLVVGKKYRINNWITDDDFTNVGGANVDGTEFTATGTTPTKWTNSSTVVEIGATLALTPEGIQPAPGQWLDASTNLLHAMQPATGSSLTRYKKDFEFRWTNTWTASSAAQYVGGLNQAVLSADHFITDVITQATVTTDVENLTLGDGSDADRFVTAFAPSATRTKQTIAAQNDGTNLKLVYTPAAEATMTVETIIRGFIWEP